MSCVLMKPEAGSCVQMCAPYNALQNYKLKVKMTPGSQRKGRAARQVGLSIPTSPENLLS